MINKQKIKTLSALIVPPIAFTGVAVVVPMAVSLTNKGGNTPAPVLTSCISFSNSKDATAASEITINYCGNGTMQFTDGTHGWTNVTPGTTYTVNAGKQFYLRGTGFGDSNIFNSDHHITIVNGEVTLGGTINDLVEYTDPASVAYQRNMFSYAFNGSTGLVGVSDDFLPATTLSNSCYYNMFAGCTNLKNAPTLPADVLPAWCYGNMFKSCSSLNSLNAFSVKTVNAYSCSHMFDGCSSLTTAPKLPATTLVDGCYEYMFAGCTNLKNAPALPASTLASACYQYMFSKSGITAAPALDAQDLAGMCYEGMFSGCTSLKSLPNLPATSLKYQCYRSMFYGCSGIRITTGTGTQFFACPTYIASDNPVKNMFAGTDSQGITSDPVAGTTYYYEAV